MENKQKHPEHICRFNDPPQDCDCFAAGYEEGLKDNQKKGEAFRKGYEQGCSEGRAAVEKKDPEDDEIKPPN